MFKKTLWATILVLALAAIPVAAFANGVWTGSPDPFLCNIFLDCEWVVPVCIDGVTYEVGIYFDPSTAESWQIEEAEEQYHEIGACDGGTSGIPWYRMVTLVDDDAPDWYYGQGPRNGTCWIKMPTTNYMPSVEDQARECGHLDHPDFVYEADRVLYDAWVHWNPNTEEATYTDPLWRAEWFDHDYRTE